MSPPPGTCFKLAVDPTLGLAFSLKSNLTVSIFLSPPLGLWDAFSNDPILDLAFHCSLVLCICNGIRKTNTIYNICEYKCFPTFFSPPLGVYLSFLASILGVAFLKSIFLDSILTFPPPGLWLAFSNDPILDRTTFKLGEGADPTWILFIGTSGENKTFDTHSLNDLKVLTLFFRARCCGCWVGAQQTGGWFGTSGQRPALRWGGRGGATFRGAFPPRCSGLTITWHFLHYPQCTNIIN